VFETFKLADPQEMRQELSVWTTLIPDSGAVIAIIFTDGRMNCELGDSVAIFIFVRMDSRYCEKLKY
jgi:hypothetical protein